MPARVAAALLALLALATSAFAQDFPSRPIRLVVSQAPGGAADRIARYVADALAASLGGGASVVVENRPGASGIIGAESVMRAPPDGHTLLLATLSTHALVPAVTPNLPYDPVRSFAPVANLYSGSPGVVLFFLELHHHRNGVVRQGLAICDGACPRGPR